MCLDKLSCTALHCVACALSCIQKNSYVIQLVRTLGIVSSDRDINAVLMHANVSLMRACGTARSEAWWPSGNEWSAQRCTSQVSGHSHFCAGTIAASCHKSLLKCSSMTVNASKGFGYPHMYPITCCWPEPVRLNSHKMLRDCARAGPPCTCKRSLDLPCNRSLALPAFQEEVGFAKRKVCQITQIASWKWYLYRCLNHSNVSCRRQVYSLCPKTSENALLHVFVYCLWVSIRRTLK